MIDNDVNRWHNNPDARLRNCGDTIRAHQNRVRGLCQDIAGRIGRVLAGSDLLYAARYHDAAEAVMGDWPGPYSEIPEVAAFKKDQEAKILASMGHEWTLTEVEQSILWLCDKLDAWMVADAVATTGTREWETTALRMERKAYEIGGAAPDWLMNKLFGPRLTLEEVKGAAFAARGEELPLGALEVI